MTHVISLVSLLYNTSILRNKSTHTHSFDFIKHGSKNSPTIQWTPELWQAYSFTVWVWYPDFNKKEFEMYQLVATNWEKDLLSVFECLDTFHTFLCGQQLLVWTDCQNFAIKVKSWQLEDQVLDDYTNPFGEESINSITQIVWVWYYVQHKKH